MRKFGAELISLDSRWSASVEGAKNHVTLCLFMNSVRNRSTLNIMAESKINEIINANKIVIFSKTYCPFCNKVRIYCI